VLVAFRKRRILPAGEGWDDGDTLTLCPTINAPSPKSSPWGEDLGRLGAPLIPDRHDSGVAFDDPADNRTVKRLISN
jgi:hypothetical protein